MAAGALIVAEAGGVVSLLSHFKQQITELCDEEQIIKEQGVLPISFHC